jgi:5-methylcytosine-specific restriction enzyme B
LAHATHKNVLRINIHSASSNADMMQGIGVSTNKDGQISYHEKKGLLLHHIQKAIAHPYQPFVIVLEEIQENSLNQLIGDLIYLIEEEKRANIGEAIKTIGDTFADMEDFLEKLNAEYFVEVPYLVSTETHYQKLVIPNNLYFFCTSNYRDDKKIVEDNLLRRFDLIEIYPTYDGVIEHPDVVLFLKALNDSILKHFKSREIHPDRFMIGHASWINVNNEKTFCRALLKAITEFKDIREIEFSDIEPVLNDLKTLPFALIHNEILRGDYKTIIDTLQKRAYADILDA